MKLNEIIFCGFSKAELDQVREKTGKEGEEEYTIPFSQEVAEVVGSGVTTIISPDGAVALIRGTQNVPIP